LGDSLAFGVGVGLGEASPLALGVEAPLAAFATGGFGFSPLTAGLSLAKMGLVGGAEVRFIKYKAAATPPPAKIASAKKIPSVYFSMLIIVTTSPYKFMNYKL
jgi:hypothetical protein